MSKIILFSWFFILVNHEFYVFASNRTYSERIIKNNQYNVNDFDLSWTDLGDRIRLRFRVSNFTSSNVWAGIAFSKDMLMGDDDAIICKTFNNNSLIERVFLSGKTRPALLNPSRPRLGLSNLSINFKNGVLTCNITRLKGGQNRKILNVRNKFHLLMAKGRTDINGNCMYHGSNRFASKSTFQFNLRRKNIRRN